MQNTCQKAMSFINSAPPMNYKRIILRPMQSRMMDFIESNKKSTIRSKPGSGKTTGVLIYAIFEGMEIPGFRMVFAYPKDHMARESTRIARKILEANGVENNSTRNYIHLTNGSHIYFKSIDNDIRGMPMNHLFIEDYDMILQFGAGQRFNEFYSSAKPMIYHNDAKITVTMRD